MTRYLYDPLGTFLRWRAAPPIVPTTATIEKKLAQALNEIALNNDVNFERHLRRHFPWVSESAVASFMDRLLTEKGPDLLQLFDEHFPRTRPEIPWDDRVLELGGPKLVRCFRELKRKGFSNVVLKNSASICCGYWSKPKSASLQHSRRGGRENGAGPQHLVALPQPWMLLTDGRCSYPLKELSSRFRKWVGCITIMNGEPHEVRREIAFREAQYRQGLVQP